MSSCNWHKNKQCPVSEEQCHSQGRARRVRAGQWRARLWGRSQPCEGEEAAGSGRRRAAAALRRGGFPEAVTRSGGRRRSEGRSGRSVKGKENGGGRNPAKGRKRRGQGGGGRRQPCEGAASLKPWRGAVLDLRPRSEIWRRGRAAATEKGRKRRGQGGGGQSGAGPAGRSGRGRRAERGGGGRHSGLGWSGGRGVNWKNTSAGRAVPCKTATPYPKPLDQDPSAPIRVSIVCTGGLVSTWYAPQICSDQCGRPSLCLPEPLPFSISLFLGSIVQFPLGRLWYVRLYQ
jgi:hypothetical protein